MLSLASVSGRNLPDVLVGGISLMAARSPWELDPHIRLLSATLDREAMIRRVTQAVADGQESGVLRQEDGAAVLAAMTRQLQHGIDAQRIAGMRRADFERALLVSPGDDPVGAVRARKTVERYAARHTSTDDDRERAAEWLAGYSRHLSTQPSESQDEPAADN
jgi:hypothetical protein